MRYFYGELPDQFCDLFKPEGLTKPQVAILIHGGYWKDNHTLDSYGTRALIPILLQKGMAVWNVEYRRMEADGINQKAPWPAVFNDIAKAVDHLRFIADSENICIARAVAIGHSAGGCLALWAAYRHKISANSPLFNATPLKIAKVLSIAGVVNLYEANDLCQPQQIARLMGGTSTEVPERYQSCDPKSLFDPSIPTFLYHGVKDDTVNINQVIFFQKHNTCETNLFISTLADHFSMLPDSHTVNLLHWVELEKLINKLIY